MNLKHTTLDNRDIIVRDERILNLDRIVNEVMQTEEWEAVKMNILEIGMAQGMETGFQKGIQRGEDRLAQLLKLLKSAGRNEDADRVVFDEEYRKQLYQEFEFL